VVDRGGLENDLTGCGVPPRPPRIEELLRSRSPACSCETRPRRPAN
jgi:hypothetical protein